MIALAGGRLAPMIAVIALAGGRLAPMIAVIALAGGRLAPMIAVIRGRVARVAGVARDPAPDRADLEVADVRPGGV